MVVLPLPVGEETPMRVTPLSSAERQSWMHSSWYGRREKVGGSAAEDGSSDASSASRRYREAENGMETELEKSRIGGFALKLKGLSAALLVQMDKVALAKSSGWGTLVRPTTLLDIRRDANSGMAIVCA